MEHKIISLLVMLLCTLNMNAQREYWQQQVSYKMEIDMDVKSNQFTGKQTLEYTNNSPDTLDRVFYHLYFNAFQPGSMMDIRSRTIDDPDGRVMDRISKLKPDEIGFIKVSSLVQDGSELSFQTVGTILEVDLDQPILPGSTTLLDMEFTGQVPIQIRRSGRDNAEGVRYSMSQWYPKLSEYDYRGWHPNPYIGREFHGVWGDFELILHIDKDYVVAATGYLQNPDEVGHGYSDTKGKSKGGKLTWHFKAPMVHDFMWAADPHYTHLTSSVPDGPELHFFYIADSATSHWEKLPEYTVKAVEFMNEHYGVYPYDQYSVVQGGDGGMEYPMSTLVTGHRSLTSQVGVVVHELVHSWYQSVLANNESLFSWMDEGFTEYVSAEIMDQLFDRNSQPHPHMGHIKSYLNLVKSGKEEPLTTHADHFDHNYAFGVASYSKGAVFLRQLNSIVGEANFSTGMLEYFNQWKFKHPEPNDFKRIMEKESGIILSWYFENWINTTKTIDYAVGSVEGDENQSQITLERNGGMMMPIDIKVTLTTGDEMTYYIPLRVMRGHKPLAEMKLAESWPWTYPTYLITLDIPFDEIQSLEIDPSKQLADINRANNVYSREMIDQSSQEPDN